MDPVGATPRLVYLEDTATSESQTVSADELDDTLTRRLRLILGGAARPGLAGRVPATALSARCAPGSDGVGLADPFGELRIQLAWLDDSKPSSITQALRVGEALRIRSSVT